MRRRDWRSCGNADIHDTLKCSAPVSRIIYNQPLKDLNARVALKMNEPTDSSPSAISSRCYIISNYQRFIKVVADESTSTSPGPRGNFRLWCFATRGQFHSGVFSACNRVSSDPRERFHRRLEAFCPS